MPASAQFKDFQVNLNAEVEKIKGKFTVGDADQNTADAIIDAARDFNDAMEAWESLADDVSQIPETFKMVIAAIEAVDGGKAADLVTLRNAVKALSIVTADQKELLAPLVYGKYKLDTALDRGKAVSGWGRALRKIDAKGLAGTKDKVLNGYSALANAKDQQEFKANLEKFRYAVAHIPNFTVTPTQGSVEEAFVGIKKNAMALLKTAKEQGFIAEASVQISTPRLQLKDLQEVLNVEIAKLPAFTGGSQDEVLSNAIKAAVDDFNAAMADLEAGRRIDGLPTAVRNLYEKINAVTGVPAQQLRDFVAAVAGSVEEAAKAVPPVLNYGVYQLSVALDVNMSLFNAVAKLREEEVADKYQGVVRGVLQKFDELQNAGTPDELSAGLEEFKYSLTNLPQGPKSPAAFKRVIDAAEGVFERAGAQGLIASKTIEKVPLQRLNKVVKDMMFERDSFNNQDQEIAGDINAAVQGIGANPGDAQPYLDLLKALPQDTKISSFATVRAAALPVLRKAFDNAIIPKVVAPSHPGKKPPVKKKGIPLLKRAETTESIQARSNYDTQMLAYDQALAESAQYEKNIKQLQAMEEAEKERESAAKQKLVVEFRASRGSKKIKEELSAIKEELQRSRDSISPKYTPIAERVLAKLQESIGARDAQEFSVKLRELRNELGKIPDLDAVNPLSVVTDRVVKVLEGAGLLAEIKRTDTQSFIDAIKKLIEKYSALEGTEKKLADDVIRLGQAAISAISPKEKTERFSELQGAIALIPADTKDDALRRVRSTALPLLQEAFKGVKRTRAEKEGLVAIEEIESKIREAAALKIGRSNRKAVEVARKELESRRAERGVLLGSGMESDPIKPQEPKKPRINYGTRAHQYKADMAKYKKDLATYEREMSIRHGADTTKEDTEEKDKAVKILVDKARITGILPWLIAPTKHPKETERDYNKRMIKYSLKEGYFLAAQEQLKREEKGMEFTALTMAEPRLIQRAAEDVLSATDVRKTKESAKFIMNELKSNLRMKLDYNVELMKIEAELNLLKQGQKKLERSNIYAGDLTDRETSLGGRRDEIVVELDSSGVAFDEKRILLFTRHAESTLKSSVRTDLASPNAIDAKKAEIAKVADIEMALLEKQMLEERMKELKQAQAHAKQREDESEYYDLGRRSSSTDAQIARREIEVLKAAEKALQKQIDGVLKGRVAFKALASHEYKHLGFKEEMIPIEDQIKKEREASYKAISQAALDSTAQVSQKEPADIKKKFTKDLAAKEKLAKERAVVAAKIAELDTISDELSKTAQLDVKFLNEKEKSAVLKRIEETLAKRGAAHKQWLAKEEFQGEANQTKESERIAERVVEEQVSTKKARERELEAMPPEQQLFARINDAFKENLTIGGDRNAFKDKAKEIFAKEYEKYLDGNDLLTMDSRERFREMFNSSTDVGKKFDKELDKSYEKLTKELKQSLKKPGVLASVISSKYTLYAGKAVAMIAATAFVSGVPMLYHKLTENAARHAVAVGAADELARKFAQSDAKLKETQKAFDKFINSDAVKRAINNAMPETPGASPIKLRNELWGIVNDAKNALNNPDSSADVVQKTFSRIASAYHMKKIGVSGMFGGNPAFNSVVSDISSRSSAAALLASAQGKLTEIARAQALFSKGQNAVSDFFAASGSYITSSAPYIRITSSLPIAAVTDKLSSVAGASTVAYAALLAHTPAPVMQAISKAAEYFPKEALSKIPLSVFASTIALGLKPHVFTIGFAVIATACGPVSVGAFLGHVATGIVTSLAYSYVYGAMLGAMKWAGVGVKKGANIPDLKELAAFVDKEVKAADKKVKAEISKAVKEAEIRLDDRQIVTMRRTMESDDLSFASKKKEERDRLAKERLKQESELQAKEVVEKRIRGEAATKIQRLFRNRLEKRDVAVAEIRARMLDGANNLLKLEKELRSLKLKFEEVKSINVRKLDRSASMKQLNGLLVLELEEAKQWKENRIKEARLQLQSKPALEVASKRIDDEYQEKKRLSEDSHAAQRQAFIAKFGTEELKTREIKHLNEEIKSIESSIKALTAQIEQDQAHYKERLKEARTARVLSSMQQSKTEKEMGEEEATRVRFAMILQEREFTQDAEREIHFITEGAKIRLSDIDRQIEHAKLQIDFVKNYVAAEGRFGDKEQQLKWEVSLQELVIERASLERDRDARITLFKAQPQLQMLSSKIDILTSGIEQAGKDRSRLEREIRALTEALESSDPELTKAELSLELKRLEFRAIQLDRSIALKRTEEEVLQVELAKVKATLESNNTKVELDAASKIVQAKLEISSLGKAHLEVAQKESGDAEYNTTLKERVQVRLRDYEKQANYQKELLQKSGELELKEKEAGDMLIKIQSDNLMAVKKAEDELEKRTRRIESEILEVKRKISTLESAGGVEKGEGYRRAQVVLGSIREESYVREEIQQLKTAIEEQYEDMKEQERRIMGEKIASLFDEIEVIKAAAELDVIQQQEIVQLDEAALSIAQTKQHLDKSLIVQVIVAIERLSESTLHLNSIRLDAQFEIEELKKSSITEVLTGLQEAASRDVESFQEEKRRLEEFLAKHAPKTLEQDLTSAEIQGELEALSVQQKISEAELDLLRAQQNQGLIKAFQDVVEARAGVVKLKHEIALSELKLTSLQERQKLNETQVAQSGVTPDVAEQQLIYRVVEGIKLTEALLERKKQEMLKSQSVFSDLEFKLNESCKNFKTEEQIQFDRTVQASKELEARKKELEVGLKAAKERDFAIKVGVRRKPITAEAVRKRREEVLEREVRDAEERRRREEAREIEELERQQEMKDMKDKKLMGEYGIRLSGGVRGLYNISFQSAGGEEIVQGNILPQVLLSCLEERKQKHESTGKDPYEGKNEEFIDNVVRPEMDFQSTLAKLGIKNLRGGLAPVEKGEIRLSWHNDTGEEKQLVISKEIIQTLLEDTSESNTTDKFMAEAQRRAELAKAPPPASPAASTAPTTPLSPPASPAAPGTWVARVSSGGVPAATPSGATSPQDKLKADAAYFGITIGELHTGGRLVQVSYTDDKNKSKKGYVNLDDFKKFLGMAKDLQLLGVKTEGHEIVSGKVEIKPRQQGPILKLKRAAAGSKGAPTRNIQ